MKKDPILFPDFMKLDIRVGEVKEAAPLEGSSKLLLLQVDLGEDYGVVEILTGMQKFYAPKDFTGKKFMFLANLEPKPMAGKVSTGMLLSADQNDAPKLIEVDSAVPTGLIVK